MRRFHIIHAAVTVSLFAVVAALVVLMFTGVIPIHRGSNIGQPKATFEVLCPHCGRRLTVGVEYSGKLHACPLCSKQFVAPYVEP
jgi:hypothetical protein